MTAAVILFSIGLLCLIKGGDWFVDGAVNTARRFAVPELLALNHAKAPVMLTFQSERHERLAL